MNRLKRFLSSIRTPYILSVLPNLLITIFFWFMVSFFGDTATTTISDFLLLPLFLLGGTILTIINPVYLVTYLYMRRNHKRLDNSVFYGFNIVLLSVFFSALITVFVELIQVTKLFLNFIIIEDYLNNPTSWFLLGTDLTVRNMLYTNFMRDMFSGIADSEWLLGLMALTYLLPLFFILYGFVYIVRHFKFRVFNQGQKRLSIALVILFSLTSVLLVMIPILHSKYLDGIVSKAINMNDIKFCRDMNDYEMTRECIVKYSSENKSFAACNALSDNYIEMRACIDEVSIHSKDWRECYSLKKDVQMCIYDVARRNDYFLDLEICNVLTLDEENPNSGGYYSAMCYAKIGYETKDFGLCSRLQTEADYETCIQELDSLRQYDY